jgi:hypothetical protein
MTDARKLLAQRVRFPRGFRIELPGLRKERIRSGVGHCGKPIAARGAQLCKSCQRCAVISAARMLLMSIERRLRLIGNGAGSRPKLELYSTQMTPGFVSISFSRNQ